MDTLDKKLRLGDNVGHGFVAPVITDDQYVLGASKLPTNVLVANRNWLPFRTGDERQRRIFETFGCTCYNTLKSISQLEKRIYGETKNYSERFIYILAGVKPPGADPHVICETIRKYGLIPEEMLPFDDSITSLEQYADPKAITPEMIDEGFGWKVRNEFMHEWVFNSNLHSLEEKQRRIHEALQYSPLGASVDGWREENGLYTKPAGGEDNHWTEVAGTTQNYYHTADDSYDPFEKKLAYTYDFGFMKRYHLRRRTPEEQLAVLNEKKVSSGSLFQRVFNWVVNLKLWPFYQQWKDEKPFNPVVETIKDLNEYMEVKAPFNEPEQPQETEYWNDDRKIEEWALAIQEFEGYTPGSRSFRNKNPGNLRNKNGTFKVYATYNEGLADLIDYLTRACTGKHHAYKPEMTIRQFISVYAPDGPKVIDNYTNFICKKLLITPETLIKTLV
jgi:hypothetical protein